MPGNYYGSLPARGGGRGGRGLASVAVLGLGSVLSVFVVCFLVSGGADRAAELLESWGQIQRQTNTLSGLRFQGTPDYVANTNDAVNEGVLGKVSSGPSNMNGELFALRGTKGGAGGQRIGANVVDGDLFALGQPKPRQAPWVRGGGSSKAASSGKVASLERQAAALKRSEAQAVAGEKKLQGLEHAQAERAQALKRQAALVEAQARAAAAHTPVHAGGSAAHASSSSAAHAQQQRVAPAPQSAPEEDIYMGVTGEPAEVDAELGAYAHAGSSAAHVQQKRVAPAPQAAPEEESYMGASGDPAEVDGELAAYARSRTAQASSSATHVQQKRVAPTPQAAPEEESYMGASGEPAEVDAELAEPQGAQAEYEGAMGEPAEVDAALASAAPPSTSGLHWQDGMGTDISFINTLDFPKSMVNAVHNNPANAYNAEVTTRQAAKAPSVAHHKLASAPVQHQYRPQPAAAAADAVGGKEDTRTLAQQVARLVLGAIQPEIKRQESEIQRLEGRAPVSKSARTLQLSSNAPAPAHAHAPTHSRSWAAARAKGQQLSIKDYNMQGFFTRGNPYHSMAPENQEWQHGARKGSPCSTSGDCNHGKYWMPWQDERNEYAHHVVGGGGDEEWKRLGNDVLGRSFDDFVTPNDAYAHDMLTSGDERVDHFAHMAPQSKENQVMMYGTSAEDFDHYRDRDHIPGRGSFNRSEFRIGEDQLGASDDEVPIQLSNAPVPGPNPDHFSNWRPGSDLNMKMMNGVYWKDLKSAGLLDRWTPADEMYRKQIGIRDTFGHPLVDTVVGTYDVVSGRGAKKYPGKVWTGTHEIIEDGKGTVGSGPDMKSQGW